MAEAASVLCGGSPRPPVRSVTGGSEKTMRRKHQTRASGLSASTLTLASAPPGDNWLTCAYAVLHRSNELEVPKLGRGGAQRYALESGLHDSR
eukprot:95391-Alexandrium_andersonii.AAC.1